MNNLPPEHNSDTLALKKLEAIGTDADEQIHIMAPQVQTAEFYDPKQDTQEAAERRFAEFTELKEQREETARIAKASELMFHRLDVRYSMGTDEPIVQPTDRKAERELKTRREKGKAISPMGDEYTERIKRATEERKLAASVFRPDVGIDALRAQAVSHGIDSRQLTVYAKTAPLNEKGQADPEQLQQIKAENLAFAQDFASGDFLRQKPHLDRIVGEILNFRITPNMFEPERMVQNLPRLLRMGEYLTSLLDLQKEFPAYFAALPQFKRNMIEEYAQLAPVFGTHLTNSTMIHGYDINHNVPAGQSAAFDDMQQMSAQLFTDSYTQFMDRRSQIIHEEADRLSLLSEDEQNEQTGVQKIGQGAFKYGLPSSEAALELLQKQSGLTPAQFAAIRGEGVLNKVLLLANDFHYRLSGLNKNSAQVLFTELVAVHQGFVEESAKVSQDLSATDSQEKKALAGALGFMAMKTLSYSAVIANLESEFKFSVSMGDERKLKVKMDSDGMGLQYEGSHKRQQFKKNLVDPDGTPLPVLSSRLRELAGGDIAGDSSFAAIAMTIDAYEDFLSSAQVPPCQTELEKAAYPQRVEALCDELLAFNDRITARALGYLNTNAKDGKKKNLCKAIEKTILARDTNENNFERVGELAYRLRHFDFSSAEFAAAYTGKTITEALRNTKIATEDLKSSQHIKAGDAASVVYITKGSAPEQAVYRRGVEYRRWKGITLRDGSRVDLDEVKGAITGVNTTGGRIIDAHKSSRDVAVSRVDKLLGANVIAGASHVRFKVDGEHETIGTKMEKSGGVEAEKILRRGFEFRGGKAAAKENQKLNLAAPESLTKLYWLQTVDLICGSADRHMNNFFLQTDKNGVIRSITGIDNDMSFGEGFTASRDMNELVLMSQKNKNPFMIYSPVLEEAFPCIPKEIYDKVMALTPAALEQELRGSIRDSELEVTLTRLEALKEHFRHIKVFDMSDPLQARNCAVLTKDKTAQTVYKAKSTRNTQYIGASYFALLSNTK